MDGKQDWKAETGLMSEDRDLWRAVVKAVMNHPFP